MLQQVMRIQPCVRWAIQQGARRNFGATSVVMAKSQPSADKIQKIFIDKIREYNKLTASGKGVETDPELQKDIDREKSKLEKMYGGGDMTKFPEFEFKEVDFELQKKK